LGVEINKVELGKECGTHEGDEKFLQNFGRTTGREESEFLN
jgi:hypothetical protein